MLARCHLEAGEAVTAEGLFRAALDSLVEEDRGSERQGAKANALFPSPIHPYTRAATLGGYAELLLQWEKREREGKIAAQRAESVRHLQNLFPEYNRKALTVSWVYPVSEGRPLGGGEGGTQ